jgi:hypothetical protein
MGSTDFGRPELARGDIRADYPAEATFAAREFTREGSTHCQERTILARRVTRTRLPVHRRKGREIFLDGLGVENADR